MKLLLLPAALLLVAATFVACDDDDDEDPTSTPTATLTATGEASPTGTPEASATPEDDDDDDDDTGGDGPGGPFEGDTAPVSKPATGDGAALVVDVRMGEHENFDRFVVEFEGDILPGYTVEYVDSATQCGSGEAVALEGDAILHVRLNPANAHDDDGSTIDTADLDGPGDDIKQAVQSCDFEAVVSWELGIDGGEQPFRVSELESPTRLVIDVADD